MDKNDKHHNLKNVNKKHAQDNKKQKPAAAPTLNADNGETPKQGAKPKKTY